jgi:hypothetical protein
MGQFEVAIAQQGAGWGDPIVWVGLLLVLVGLGLLAKEVRHAFSLTPAWDGDRSGLRRTIAGLGGRPALALAVLPLLFVGSAAGCGLLSDEGPGAPGLPSDWAGLEPLLPLVPSLRDIAARKGTAWGNASGSGFGVPGLTPVASRGKRATGAGQAGLASEGSGAKGRPSVRARRRGRQSGGRSAAEGRSSRRFSSGSRSSSGTSAPRRATRSRPSTPPRPSAPAPPRSSPPPEPKPRRGGGYSKPARPRRSSRKPSASPRMRHIGRGKHAGWNRRRMAERGARGR